MLAMKPDMSTTTQPSRFTRRIRPFHPSGHDRLSSETFWTRFIGNFVFSRGGKQLYLPENQHVRTWELMVGVGGWSFPFGKAICKTMLHMFNNGATNDQLHPGSLTHPVDTAKWWALENVSPFKYGYVWQGVMSKIALFRSCLLKLKLDIQIPSQKAFLLSLSLLFKKISTGIAPISFLGVPSAEVFFFHAAGGRGEAAARGRLGAYNAILFRSERQSSSLAAASNFGMICFFRDRTWFSGISKSWKRSCWSGVGEISQNNSKFKPREFWRHPTTQKKRTFF